MTQRCAGAFCLLLVAICGPAGARDATPFHLEPARRQQLQTVLDQHDHVLLDANSDYRSLALPRIRLRSGQTLVGGWNTRVPQIEIPGGVSGIEIRQVRSNAPADVDIVFRSGAETSDVTIVGGNGGATTHVRVRIEEGARVRRLHLTSYGGLEVRQSESGYVRDSLFTGLMGYWSGPYISWQGNAREPSHGNAFLGIAAITPQRASSWRHAGNLWLVAWDCEAWNSLGKGDRECFRVEDAPAIVSIGLTGGTIHADRNAALASFRDIGSYVGWFTAARGGSLGQGDLEFRRVDSSMSIQGVDEVREFVAERTSGSQQFKLLHPLRNPGPAVPADAPPDIKKMLGGIGNIALPPKPVLRTATIIDESLLKAAKSRVDSSVSLQLRIDREGVIRLEAGIYYLDRPLRIGNARRPEGLIGAGKDAVVLVAKGDFPVIQGRGDYRYGNTGETVVNVILSDLTLYGGTNGLQFSGDPGNVGNGAQIAFSTFSNLRFSHQSRAGVAVSGIFGLDSNLWYRVDFESEPVAIRGNGTGSGAGMTYADKQHFIECQYTDIGDAVWFWTADRSSGGHIWKDNYFRNVGAISRTRAATNLLWVNSVMENVHGPVALDVTDTGLTATYFFYLIGCVVKGEGPYVFADSLSFGSGVMVIDTDFQQRNGSVVSPDGPQSLFSWNTRYSATLQPARITQGIEINSGPAVSGATMKYTWRGKEVVWK